MELMTSTTSTHFTTFSSADVENSDTKQTVSSKGYIGNPCLLVPHYDVRLEERENRKLDRSLSWKTCRHGVLTRSVCPNEIHNMLLYSVCLCQSTSATGHVAVVQMGRRVCFASHRVQAEVCPAHFSKCVCEA